MVLRGPSLIFSGDDQTRCQMSNPYASRPQVNLRPEFSKDTKLIDKVRLPDSEIQAEHALLRPMVTVDATVDFLINELMAARSASKEQAEMSSEAAHGGPSPKKDDTQYACFVMQCLTELMFSYDACKTAFLSYPDTKSRPSSLPKEGEQRTQTLSFFLNKLVTYEITQQQNNPDTYTHMQICNWAMYAFVLLCVDSSTAHEGKEISGFFIGVRKTELDAISRTIKDLPSTKSTG
ncbi:hypothetical protein CYLTODRAFT_495355 [Cylindrobasidium torrendii FP15055 ss-10]|uniref:Uncharacterized protein n=1 Tax=Cylindrobasidium torrendii FP15055 ss-10 TaxID=1314674 RepID=A0A0D7ATR9_9AGAR|nr:hypothetical protein CYLTODRAFT_495355 [Cylindrobasidium torrendii FP15055 ss-10]